MTTAIAITAIIAAVAVINIIVNAVTAKPQTGAHCKTCTCDKKETEA